MSDGPRKDPPIENPSFVGGVNVIDFGEVRVSRGLSRRPFSSCRHQALFYDQSERRIWCKDCETNIDGFDAFRLLVEQFHVAYGNLRRRAEAIEAAENSGLRTLAAKELDKAWSKRSMVPACPCCGMGLFPEDFKSGVRSMLGRDYAEALRRRNKGGGA